MATVAAARPSTRFRPLQTLAARCTRARHTLEHGLEAERDQLLAAAAFVAGVRVDWRGMLVGGFVELYLKTEYVKYQAEQIRQVLFPGLMSAALSSSFDPRAYNLKVTG